MGTAYISAWQSQAIYHLGTDAHLGEVQTLDHHDEHQVQHQEQYEVTREGEQLEAEAAHQFEAANQCFLEVVVKALPPSLQVYAQMWYPTSA